MPVPFSSTDAAPTRPAKRRAVPHMSRGALYAAAAAATLSLLLLMLGAGLGLASISPWSEGAAPIGFSTILWVGFMQLVVCAVGGYLAGRLRATWTGPDNEEIHARDRSNAVPAWVLASLVTVVLLTGGGRTILDGGTNMVSSATAASVNQVTNAVPALVMARSQDRQGLESGPHSMLWMLLALVLGVIVANLAATFGGLQRDGMLVQLREN
ncbi:hypothetical protein AAKU55_003421 [Oxalobacteraceae bacterium GrIS 1.11]